MPRHPCNTKMQPPARTGEFIFRICRQIGYLQIGYLTWYLACFENSSMLLSVTIEGMAFLGRGITRIHVTEFQKRGNPQTHIVLTVRQVAKLHNVGVDDSEITPNISNREELPFLQGTVSSTM